VNAKGIDFLVFLFASTTLTACASVVHGTTQVIQITSEPAGANAVVLPTGTTVTTPATVTLQRKKVYTVLFSSEGFEPTTVYVNKVHSDATYGNLILGGSVGLATDYSNGAAWNLAPDPVHAQLVPLSAHGEKTGPTPNETAE
jgi:hypothetical protein